MSVLSDISAAHRDLADMWDETRADLEAEGESIIRLEYRLAWLFTFLIGCAASFVIFGFLAYLITFGSDIAANAAAGTAMALFITLWISVWIRSYRLTEDDLPRVDLTK